MNKIDWDNFEIVENGVARKATPEEIAERKAFLDSLPPPAPSLEDEVEQLKQDNLELREELDAALLILTGKEANHER